MKTNQSVSTSNYNAAARGTIPSGIQTFRNVCQKLAPVIGADEKIAQDSICAQISPDTKFDVSFLQQLVRVLPEVQKQIFAKAVQRGAVQCGFSRYLDRLVAAGRDFVIQHCSQLGLGERADFLTKTIPQLSDSSAGKLVMEALQIKTGGCAGFRNKVIYVETLLRADLLTACACIQPEAFRLELACESPQLAFEYEFGALLKRCGMTQEQFATANRQYGFNESLVSEAVRGKRVPSRDCELSIKIVSIIYGAPALYDAFVACRKDIEEKNPKARAHEALSKNSVLLAFVRPEMEMLEKGHAEMVFKSTGRAISDNTVKNFRKAMGHMLAAAEACGIDLFLHGFTACLKQAVFDTMLRRAAAKRGDPEGNLRRADGTMFAQISAVLAPIEGILWRGADKFAALAGTDIETWPTHWPKDADADEPGAPCHTPAARLRALCRTLYPKVCEVVSRAEKSPCTKSHLRDLGPVRTQIGYPMTGLIIVLLRAKLSRTPVMPKRVAQALCSNALVLSMHTTKRTEDLVGTTMEEITFSKQDQFALKYGEVDKNEYSPYAQSRIDLVAREVNPIALPYHKWRLKHGPQNPDAPYYLTADLRPITAERLRYLVGLFMERFGADLFPHSVQLNHLRHIATTEACQRCGKVIGLKLAAYMNRHSPKTSDENYLLDLSVPRFVEGGPATVNELLRLVFREARKLKSILNYTVPAIR